MIDDLPSIISTTPCDRCEHGAYFHRLDDALSPTDPLAPFQCIWPLPDGRPPAQCDCPDFVSRLKEAR